MKQFLAVFSIQIASEVLVPEQFEFIPAHDYHTSLHICAMSTSDNENAHQFLVCDADFSSQRRARRQGRRRGHDATLRRTHESFAAPSDKPRKRNSSAEAGEAFIEQLKRSQANINSGKRALSEIVGTSKVSHAFAV